MSSVSSPKTLIMKKLEILNFLKGYAIFTIVIFHLLQYCELPQPFDRLISFGGTGVHLFVLLSGFGLYLSHLNNPISFTAFIQKRFSKIYIPYIIVVFLTALSSVLFGFYKDSLYALGGHLFLYKMFDESIVGSYGYQLWFVSMIIQFYLVFLILVKILDRLSNRQSLIFGLLISLFWALSIYFLGLGDLRIWNSFFLQFLWEFILGMVLARAYQSNGLPNVKMSSSGFIGLGLLFSLIYMVMALFLPGIGKLINDVPALFGYSFIAVGLYKMGLSQMNNFFLYTGRISYSVFLLHYLCLSYADLLLADFGKVPVVVFTLILTYLSSHFYQGWSTKVVNRLNLKMKKIDRRVQQLG